MKIYLDACCLNRPFDDQAQPRIHLESEAVILILKQAEQDRLLVVGSDVVLYEIAQTPDPTRRQRVTRLAEKAAEHVPLSSAIIARGNALEHVGFGSFDALHIACAEAAKAVVLLTTDDHMWKKANAHSATLNVVVENPVTWISLHLQP